MQPNNQQGSYQPDQNQPVQPSQPLQPVQPLQPLQPLAQPQTQQQPYGPTPVAPTPGVAPVVDPAALQQALSESTPEQVPQQQFATEELEQYEGDELEEGDEEYIDEPVIWQAHEFIHREKGTGWFIAFGVVILALIAISVLTQAWSFTVLIVVIALVVIVYTRRPPRELTYSITDEGLTIDGTLHKFSTFKSFGIIHDGEEYSVMLIPTQRFQPGVSVYFPEEAGEDIVDMLGSRLPMKDLKLDAVDRVVRLLRL